MKPRGRRRKPDQTGDVARVRPCLRMMYFLSSCCSRSTFADESSVGSAIVVGVRMVPRATQLTVML